MRYFGLIVLSLLMMGSLPAVEPGSGRMQALERMGELNGVALACGYFEQTRRIKEALIEYLPKRRELGQKFDDDTNAAFLEFHGSGRPCPSPAQFEAEVDEAVKALAGAYAGAGGS